VVIADTAWAEAKDTRRIMNTAAESKLSAKAGRLAASRGLACRRVVCCLLALLVSFGVAQAQGQRFARLADKVFYSITRESGLPNEIPLALAQDSEGFIWVGSEGGLARWDGTHFRLYSAGSGAADALPDNVVTVLHADRQGRLWIGTDAAGLARYDPATDSFVRVHLGVSSGAGVAGVHAIIDDAAGGLWVGTGSGLLHIDRSMRIVAELTATAGKGVIEKSGVPRNSGGLPDDRVHALLLDRHGALWVGTMAGLARAAPGSTDFEPVDLPLAAGSALDVNCLLEDHQGRVWVGTRRNGAYVIGANGGRASAVPANPANAGGTPTYGVMALLEIRPGDMWLGTDGDGILEIQDGVPGAKTIRHDPSISTSLVNDSVRALYRDRAGLVWVATDRGMGRYDPGQPAVATLFGVGGRSDRLSDPDIMAILPRPDGTIWAGLRYHGIDIVDPDAGTIRHLRPNPATPKTALPAWAIASLVALPGGDVLAGSDDGLYLVNGAGTKATRLMVPGRPADLGVLSLCLCHGSIWMGDPGGLWQLSIDPGGATTHVLRREDASRLTDPRVQVIAEAPDGRIWAGTPNGLNLVGDPSVPIERIFPDRRDPTRLVSGEVISLLTDAAGRLWVGTLDGGIDVMTGRARGVARGVGETGPGGGRPVFRPIGLRQGLPNEDIGSLQMDASGRIWASTDDGLAVIDPGSFAVHALGRPEGVAIPTYWNNAGAATGQGEVLFGGVGGLTVVSPALFARTLFRAPLVITDVRVGGRQVWAGHPDAQGVVQAVVLGPEQNSLSVAFTALDYAGSQNDHFAYRLEGFDPDWIENESQPRLAAYTNLPPGRYVLRLRGAGRAGAWAGPPVALPVLVLPSWYQTPWFRLAMLAAAAILMAALVQARTALLRQRQRELERQVAERTAELSLTQAQLRHFAYVDMLTGLPNRRAFHEEFRRLIDEAQRCGSRLALLLLDMDGFKLVNDTRGHDAGDALLMVVAGRLRSAVRDSDYVCRLGGDEFAVLLLVDEGEEQIECVCRRITESFIPPVALDGHNLLTRASIGVAVFPDHGATQERIYKSADVAMYAAKREGRGTWRRFHGAKQHA